MTEVKKMTTVYNIIHKTGELSNTCREWQHKLEAENTWEAFKLHFSREYKDYKDELSTKTAHSYEANKVVEDTFNLQHCINEV